jgi:hypothetical protein
MSSLGTEPVASQAIRQAVPIIAVRSNSGIRRPNNAQQYQRNRAVRWRKLEKAASNITQSADKIAATGILSGKAGKEINAWGNDMQLDSEHCRILYNNCRGIQQESNFAKCHEIGDTVNEMNVDILGLAETNLDWSNHETDNACDSIFRKHWGPTKVNKSSSDVTFNSPYQPGGTMTMVRGKWAGRTRAEGSDGGLGRWSELRMEGKEGRAVLIITAYRVVANQVLATAGPRTAFRQQWKLLHSSGIENPNPRKQVLLDLATRIEDATKAGDEVVLMIDANESLNDSRSEFSKFVRRTKLVDIVGQRHGTADDRENLRVCQFNGHTGV